MKYTSRNALLFSFKMEYFSRFISLDFIFRDFLRKAPKRPFPSPSIMWLSWDWSEIEKICFLFHHLLSAFLMLTLRLSNLVGSEICFPAWGQPHEGGLEVVEVAFSWKNSVVNAAFVTCSYFNWALKIFCAFRESGNTTSTGTAGRN